MTFWNLYLFDFIFSGLIRANLPHSLSNVFFFTRALIILFFVITSRKEIHDNIKFKTFFLTVSVLLTLYQFIYLVFDELGPITFLYGLYLYVIPILGLLIKSKHNLFEIITGTTPLIKISIWVNFSLVAAQTVFQISSLYSAGFGEGLYSAGGIQRATGSFSSAAGYGIYISVIFFYLVSLRIIAKEKNLNIYWMLFLFMVIMSGSRTIIFNLLFAIIVFIFFNRRNNHIKSMFRNIFTSAIIVFVITFMTDISHVASAGISRFIGANSVNPPFSRLWQQISINLNDLQLFGSGLSTHALGSVININSRVTFSNWIEFDNQRVAVEAGLFFLVLILITKILFLRNSVLLYSEYSDYNKPIRLLLLVTYSPFLFFGQVNGQASIASGTFYLVYLSFRSGMRKNEES